MSRSKGGEYKIVLLGEGRVGKTSLIARFVNDSFNEDEKSTTQATMYSVKSVPVGGGGRSGRRHSNSGGGSGTGSGGGAAGLSSSSYGPQSVKLAVWDTAGQERFHALAPIYYRNAAGAVLVYDVCDADSLRKVRTWVKELRTVAGDAIRLVVCGNKCDRPAAEQEVSPAEAHAVAAEIAAEHFFTSAKTGAHVAEAFGAMATAVYESAGGGGAPLAGGGYETLSRRRPHRSRLAADEDDEVSDLFLDVGGESGSGSGWRRTSPQPPRAARPLTLEDLRGPGEQHRSTNPTSGGGNNGDSSGGCC